MIAFIVCSPSRSDTGIDDGSVIAFASFYEYERASGQEPVPLIPCQLLQVMSGFVLVPGWFQNWFQ